MTEQRGWRHKGTIPRRWRITLVALAAALFGAGLPIAVSVYVARDLTLRDLKANLDFYKAVPVQRADAAFRQASRILDTVDAYSDCSPNHIAVMRRLAMRSPFVDEVGFFRDGELACTSWGLVEPGIKLTRGDFTTPDGLDVTARMLPVFTRGEPALAIRKNDHNVLVSHFRLVELTAADDVSVAVAYRTSSGDAFLLGDDGTPAGKWLLDDLQDKPLPADQVGRTAAAGPFVALAVSPLSSRDAMYVRFLLWMLPVGVAFAALVLANVYWLMRRHLKLDREILAALRDGEMHLVYQPVMDLKSGACIGAEALLRWQRPDGEYIRPDIFIAVAEEHRIIGRLTRFVVRRALDDLGPLLREDDTAHVALNISAGDIGSGDFPAFLAAELRRARVPTQSVFLEVTERGLIDPQASRETFAALRDAGHRVAIDDFGTGYSSLQYLQDLPLDALKIDKSFVDAIGIETARRAVIEHIIALAASLDLFVVAEGIESTKQLDYLKARRVRYGQGYLFSLPLERDDFVRFFKTCKAQVGPAVPPDEEARRELQGERLYLAAVGDR